MPRLIPPPMIGFPTFKITDEVIKKARHAASYGLTNEQIAPLLGISLTTLQIKVKEFPELSTAMEQGRSEKHLSVSQKLIEAAEEGDAARQMFYLERKAGWRREDKTEVKLTIAPLFAMDYRTDRERFLNAEPIIGQRVDGPTENSDGIEESGIPQGSQGDNAKGGDTPLADEGRG